jgi:TfoX/Sxy family transcriptional regulator of competence genes
MAYDQELASRLQEILRDLPVIEKKMFGGVGFLINGNMLCGVHGGNLIARVGPGRYEESLANRFAQPFDMTGRPMTGWVEVIPEGLTSIENLKAWVDKALQFVSGLPSK